MKNILFGKRDLKRMNNISLLHTVDKVTIMVLMDYIQNLPDCHFPVIILIFKILDLQVMNIPNPKLSVKYQLRIEQDEKIRWMEYAKQYYGGNLARMIRTVVNQKISGISDTPELPEEITEAINVLTENSEQNNSRIESFESDLMIIKSLLSQLLQKQSNHIMQYSTSPSLPLRDIVFALFSSTSRVRTALCHSMNSSCI